MADLGFAICELRFAIWELGILINPQTFRPSDLQTFRPSDLQTFRPTDLQTFRPSDFPTHRPSDLQTSRPSDLQTFRPSDLQTSPPLPVALTSFFSLWQARLISFSDMVSGGAMRKAVEQKRK